MYKIERDSFKFRLIEDAKLAGKYGVPQLKATQDIPAKLISFNECFRCKNPGEHFVHFYIDDYQFERLWNTPGKYLEILRKFAGVIGPDFSLYRDMPRAQQIWNDFRNKALSYFLQSHKINLIPNVSWSDAKSFDFVFAGLPQNSTLAISTNGVTGKLSSLYFMDGYIEMLHRLQPTAVIVYGPILPEMQGTAKLIQFDNKLQQLQKEK